MKTKFWIALTLSVLLLLPAALFAAGTKPYEGVSINLGLLARGVSDALKPYLADFTAETGIRVNIEQHAYDSLRDKMMLEFAAKSGYFDIIYLSPGYLGELVENDYLLSLNEFMEKLDFRREDFLPAAIEISRSGTGEHIWGFPYLADTSILLYRKDLFEDTKERAAFQSVLVTRYPCRPWRNR